MSGRFWYRFRDHNSWIFDSDSDSGPSRSIPILGPIPTLWVHPPSPLLESQPWTPPPLKTCLKLFFGMIAGHNLYGMEALRSRGFSSLYLLEMEMVKIGLSWEKFSFTLFIYFYVLLSWMCELRLYTSWIFLCLLFSNILSRPLIEWPTDKTVINLQFIFRDMVNAAILINMLSSSTEHPYLNTEQFSSCFSLLLTQKNSSPHLFPWPHTEQLLLLFAALKTLLCMSSRDALTFRKVVCL